MAVGLGIPETLFASQSGGRASDPFGSKTDRGINPYLYTQSTNLANSLQNQGIEATRAAKNALLTNLYGIPDINAPIDMNSITANPAYGALKDAIESQFNVARQNVLATNPAGGALGADLTSLERGRAGALAQGIGGLAQTEADRRLQALLGVGGALGSIGASATGQAGSILGGLGQQQSQLAASNIAADASNKNNKMGFQNAQIENLSSGLGAMAGGK